MSGGSLVYPGDVQIGADGDSPVLLRSRVSPSLTVQNNTSNAWWFTEFNPMVAGEWLYADESHPGRAGVRQAVDVPSTKVINLELILHYTSNSALTTALSSLRHHLEPLALNIFHTVSGQPRFESEIAWMGPDSTKWVIFGRFRAVGTKDLRYYGRNRLDIIARFECSTPIIYEAVPIEVEIPYQTAIDGTFPETDQGAAGYVYYPYYYTDRAGYLGDFTGPLSRPGYINPIWPYGGSTPELVIDFYADGFNAPARWKAIFTTDAVNPTLWTLRLSHGNYNIDEIFGFKWTSNPVTSATFATDNGVVLGYRNEARTVANYPLDLHVMLGSSYFQAQNTMNFQWTGLSKTVGGITFIYQRGKYLVV